MVSTTEDANCTFDLDGGGVNPMTLTGGLAHEEAFVGVANGQHTLDVDCNAPGDGSNDSESTTFTIGNGGGNRGGGAIHRACQNNQCVWVSGSGANECNADVDCGGNVLSDDDSSGVITATITTTQMETTIPEVILLVEEETLIPIVTQEMETMVMAEHLLAGDQSKNSSLEISKDIGHLVIL